MSFERCPHCGEQGHDQLLYNGTTVFVCPNAHPDRIYGYPKPTVRDDWLRSVEERVNDGIRRFNAAWIGEQRNGRK